MSIAFENTLFFFFSFFNRNNSRKRANIFAINVVASIKDVGKHRGSFERSEERIACHNWSPHSRFISRRNNSSLFKIGIYQSIALSFHPSKSKRNEEER